MANRYSELTPSAYTPLTLEEIAMVPAMRRKQHDAVLAQQEAIRSGLTKVDPLDVHFDKALELKKAIEGKMDATAAELAANGINPDMIGKTLALNREVQDLISPMGDIGKINASKVEYNKQMENFLKSAEAQKIGSARALDLWKEKTKGYTGYDDKGKILNVTPQGVAAYQDYEDDLAKKHSMLGKTITGVSSAGHKLEHDGKGNFWEVTRDNKRVVSQNAKQVEAAYKAFRDKWIAESGEGTAYARDAGLGIDEARIANDFAAMLESSDVSDVKETANYNQYDPTKDPNYAGPNIPGAYSEDYNTQEVGGNRGNYDDIMKIGTGAGKAVPSGYDPVTGTAKYRESGKKDIFTVDNIKDPKQKALYEKMWQRATTGNGIILDGKRVHLNPALIKRGKNDRTVAFQLLRAIKQNPAITLTSKLITNDVDLDNSGFAESIGKTSDDRDKQIRKQLKLTNSGARKLLDPKTGESITFEEAQKRYNLKGVDTVTYHGYISPLNWEEKSFNGINSQASPHVITVENSDGKFVEFKTSRLNSDNVGINIKRYNDLNKNYRTWSIDRDEFIPFESESKNLSNLKVKYNTKNPKIDPRRGVLEMEILDENGQIHYMTQDEFVDSVNATQ